MIPTTTLGSLQIHARNTAVVQSVGTFEIMPTKDTVGAGQ